MKIAPHQTYIARQGCLPECEASVEVESTIDPLLDIRLG